MTQLSTIEPALLPAYPVVVSLKKPHSGDRLEKAAPLHKQTLEMFSWPEEYAHHDGPESSWCMSDLISDPMIALLNTADGVSTTEFRNLLKTVSIQVNAQSTRQ